VMISFMDSERRGLSDLFKQESHRQLCG
jgi:hypothetical protein